MALLDGKVAVITGVSKGIGRPQSVLRAGGRGRRLHGAVYTIHSCLTSSYVCTRFAVEMIKAGGGAIVNISSGAGTTRASATARPRPARLG